MELLTSLFQNMTPQLSSVFSLFLQYGFGFFGCVLAFFVYIKMSASYHQEKNCTLDALRILSTCPQEWFCFYPALNRGIASEGLSSYLGDDHAIVHLKKFNQALFQKFSFDIEPLLENISASPLKSHSFKLHCPKTRQSCDLIIFFRTSSPLEEKAFAKRNFVFWLTDTSQVSAKEKHYQEHQSKLEAQNNQFSTLLNSLPQPVWIRNQQGQLLYCNQFYADILEGSVSQVIEDNKLLWRENRLDRLSTQHFESLILAEPLKRSIILKEERRLYEFSEQKVPQQSLIFGQAVDMTDIEAATHNLQQHSKAYQEVMDNLSAGVTIYGADKKLKFFNHAYALLFEIDENWLNTHSSLGEVLDDLRDRRLLCEQADYLSFKKQQLQMVSSLLSPYQQLEHLPNGRTIRRITAPHPLGGVFFIFEDITTSLALERQYNTQLAVHRASLDHLYEGVAIFGSDNRLKLYNPAFAEIWGITKEDFKIDQHMSDAIDQIRHIVNYEGTWEEYRTYLISNVTDRISKKTRMLCREDKAIDITYVPLPDGSHLLSCIDVSDAHRFEKILQERTRTLENADDLKSDIMVQSSYKIQKPLNTISGLSEILVQNYLGPLNSQQLFYYQSILDTSHHLLSLTDGITELAIIEHGDLDLNPQEIDVLGFLERIKLFFENTALEKEIIFKLICAKNIGTFWADEKRLHQALRALLKNAFSFTAMGGTVTLKCQKNEEEIMFRISDTGIGIPLEEQDLVFLKFVTGSNNLQDPKGPGLGLTLAQKLIEAQGGRINMTSEINKETHISCYFKGSI